MQQKTNNENRTLIGLESELNSQRIRKVSKMNKTEAKSEFLKHGPSKQLPLMVYCEKKI